MIMVVLRLVFDSEHNMIHASYNTIIHLHVYKHTHIYKEKVSYG